MESSPQDGSTQTPSLQIDSLYPPIEGDASPQLVKEAISVSFWDQLTASIDSSLAAGPPGQAVPISKLLLRFADAIGLKSHFERNSDRYVIRPLANGSFSVAMAGCSSEPQPPTSSGPTLSTQPPPPSPAMDPHSAIDQIILQYGGESKRLDFVKFGVEFRKSQGQTFQKAFAKKPLDYFKKCPEKYVLHETRPGVWDVELRGHDSIGSVILTPQQEFQAASQASVVSDAPTLSSSASSHRGKIAAPKLSTAHSPPFDAVAAVDQLIREHAKNGPMRIAYLNEQFLKLSNHKHFQNCVSPPEKLAYFLQKRTEKYVVTQPIAGDWRVDFASKTSPLLLTPPASQSSQTLDSSQPATQSQPSTTMALSTLTQPIGQTEEALPATAPKDPKDIIDKLIMQHSTNRPILLSRLGDLFALSEGKKFSEFVSPPQKIFDYLKQFSDRYVFTKTSSGHWGIELRSMVEVQADVEPPKSKTEEVPISVAPEDRPSSQAESEVSTTASSSSFQPTPESEEVLLPFPISVGPKPGLLFDPIGVIDNLIKKLTGSRRKSVAVRIVSSEFQQLIGFAFQECVSPSVSASQFFQSQPEKYEFSNSPDHSVCLRPGIVIPDSPISVLEQGPRRQLTEIISLPPVPSLWKTKAREITNQMLASSETVQFPQVLKELKRQGFPAPGHALKKFFKENPIDFELPSKSCIQLPKPDLSRTRFKGPNGPTFVETRVMTPLISPLQVIVVSGPTGVQPALDRLMSSVGSDLLVGIDVEAWWGSPELLQLSTDRVAVLLHLRVRGITTHPTLTSFLSDSRILKCGCEAAKDALDVFQWLGTRFEGVVDLTPFGINDLDQKTGLKTLFQKLTGVAFEKSKKITLSNWSLIPLTERQVQYAALDAWVSLQVARGMSKHVNLREYAKPVGR